ncbi:hypothetical protein ASZ90_018707 [hydrocarbon metagenome]|uniref:Uncharacterized protein n=1 Tax=hydrocarbon metagenome TaxID=938273 RepID=A0A0W8E5I4_9ZZZZ
MALFEKQGGLPNDHDGHKAMAQQGLLLSLSAKGKQRLLIIKEAK